MYISATRAGRALFLGAVVAATFVHQPDAAACGGTFCDNSNVPVNQAPMPVDQTGENVLFSIQDGIVEAHVQIQYTGDPEQFAWIVPLQAIPEVEVGSQLLFGELLRSSVPLYDLTQTFEQCAFSGSSLDGGSSDSGCSFGCSSDDSGGDGGGYGGASAGTGGSTAIPEPDPPGVAVVLNESVGSFDVTILEAQTAADISLWLTDNNFVDDGAATPILGEYIDAGYVFAAVRLQETAGIDEIHPLVFRYAGTEPCIPLKLTRIAAVEDMTVRAFFLGDRRVVPTNDYAHVDLNEAQLDWINGADNYLDVVSRAVDEPGSNGRGFITEYAGSSVVVNRSVFYSSSWEGGTADDYLDAVPFLESKSLMTCTSSSCFFNHPMVLPLLRRYLPAPVEVSEAAFYACPECSLEQAPPEWDAAGFLADYEALIVGPARNANEIVDNASYLTRLLTTISPSEMSVDPTFAETSVDLGNVSTDRVGTQDFRCDGSTIAEVDGYEVDVTATAFNWPVLPEGLPYAETIQVFDSEGQLAGEVDNTEAISTYLDPVEVTAASLTGGETPEFAAQGGSCQLVSHRSRVSTQMAWTLAAIAAVLYRRRRRR